MRRRLPSTIALAILVAVAAAATSSASPGHALLFDSDRTGNYEIFEMDEEGVRGLTSDVRFDSWWPRPSPDRRKVLFYRTPKGIHDRDFTRTALWIMNADGSDSRELRPSGTDGWAVQGHAEWAPDGRRLVMFGGRRFNPQIYVTDAEGRAPRQVTRRGGVNLDPSWAPDGRHIAFVGCPRSFCTPASYEIYAIAADGIGEPRRLTDDDLRDHDPVYSPDGKRLAWLTQTSPRGVAGQWGIRIAGADGGPAGIVIDDGAINSRPAWSPDGERLYFHRLAEGRRFRLCSIRPDGTDLRMLTDGSAGNDEYPAP